MYFVLKIDYTPLHVYCQPITLTLLLEFHLSLPTGYNCVFILLSRIRAARCNESHTMLILK